MKTNQKIHQLHLNEWAQRFANQKASGLTVKQWCEDNNFTIHAYNYWKRVFKEEVGNQVLPDIVPLVLPEAECFDSFYMFLIQLYRAFCILFFLKY